MLFDYVTNYKDNKQLRQSFNALTEKTFKFNFENWYQNGFWTEKYIPYSLVDNGKIVANVSVNLMDFSWGGKKKHYIQLGTIMTDTSYRGQGLSRYLIEKVLSEWKDQSDGIYLFGNDSVLDFYPKFGFIEVRQYQYKKDVKINCPRKVKKVDMTKKDGWHKLTKAIKYNHINSSLVMDNAELIMFYATAFMNQSVYYFSEENTYIIADIKEDTLFIHDVFAPHSIDMTKIINAFGHTIEHVSLGFTPNNKQGYEVEEVKEEDTTLFVLGDDLRDMFKEKIMFPTLSHA